MRTRKPLLAAVSAAALILAGCSSGDSTDGSSDGSTAMAGGSTSTADAGAMQECQPVPGDTLTVLEDDQQLQLSDNMIPAVATDAATSAVMAALDAVSAVLTTDDLIALNKAVDVDRQTSEEAAQAYVDAQGLTAPEPDTGSVVVGAANFSESITVATIYALVLEDAGFDTEVRTVGTRETYIPALVSGEVQVVPEYAATLTEYLNRDQNGADAALVASGDIGETVAALAPLAEAAGITMGEPSEAQDQNAFAVTEAFAAQYGVATLSELASTCGTITLGGPPECPERDFCQLGLEEVYGLEIAQFDSLDPGGPLTKTAIQQGQVMVGLVFSSDGALG